MVDVTKFVGAKIKEYRKAIKMTQKELGEKIGVKHNTVSSYESGTNEVEHDILFKIAETLNKNINDFFPDRQPSFNEEKSNVEFIAHSPDEEIVMVPIVGRISCGDGILTYEEIEGHEGIPRNWMNGGDYFVLRAKGDSMTGFRIEEGDLLLIREQPMVENGEIAAVDINGEAVLKRVTRSGNSLILESGNPKYEPRVVDVENTDCVIIGKLCKSITTF